MNGVADRPTTRGAAFAPPPPPPSKLWSVRALVLALMLVTLTPGVIGVGILLHRLYHDGREQVEKDTVQTARAMAQAVDGQIKYAKAIAIALSTSRLITSGDWATFHARARDLLKTEGIVATVLVVDKTGQQFVNTQIPFGDAFPKSNPLDDRLRRVFENGDIIVTDVAVNERSSPFASSVVVPVRVDSKIPYALSLSITPQELGEILAQQGLPPAWRSVVADANGTIAARSTLAEQIVGKQINAAMLGLLTRSVEGTLEGINKEGVPSLMAYSRSPEYGWTVAIAIPIDLVQSDLKRGFLILGIAGLMLFVAGGWFAWLLGGRISRSVQTLTQSAVAMESGESLTASVVSFREAEQADQAMVRTSAMLRQRADALQVSDATLSEERRNALAAEVQAVKAKSQFLAMVSHELRSPLQAILSAINLLELGHGQGVERRSTMSRSLPVIRAAVDSLSAQVRDLLTLASGEVGRLEMRPEAFDAVALVHEVAELHRPRADEKGLVLEVVAPHSPVFVVADPTRIAQVLTNLISNAIKYTTEGSVTVALAHVCTGSGRLEIQVKDTGPGVPQNFASHMFAPYERRGTVEPDRQSAGIGLAVVHTVVTHLGGTVTFDSQSGVGTTFNVSIPVADVVEQEPRQHPGVSYVLIVDDRADVLTGLADVIRAMGHRCDVAESAAVGANVLGARVYDLVLIDLNMPVKSGYEFASETRRGGGPNENGVLVAISADDAQEVGKAWPFDGFLAKPIDRKTLRSTLDWAQQENLERRAARAPEAPSS